MTGYARAQGSDERRRWVWEARSVNGRNLEIRCRVPQGFDRLENPARAAIGNRMKRGNVSLTLTIASEQQSKPLRVNRALLAELAGLVEEVRKGTGAAATASCGCAASSRKRMRQWKARRRLPPSIVRFPAPSTKS
jgi:uncharacterized protein (TIGR00255 family)